MLVSFIVPTYNSEKTIRECIESILKQKCKKEVIVVDGCSTDKTREILREYPIKLLVEKKKGPAAARNKGLRTARGKYIAFIDSDVVLPPFWIKKALKLLRQKDIAGVGGPGISPEKSIVSESLNALLYGKTKNVRKIFVDSLATMDVVYKKSMIENEFFDESLTSGEDPEFNFRIRKRRFKLLFSRELYVYHYHPTNLISLIKKWYNYGKNYPVPYFKHQEMRNLEFYLRIFYIPLLIFWFLLSIFDPHFMSLILIQITSLFLVYFIIGIKVVNVKVLLFFSIIHTIKQLAQLIGIWVGITKKILSKLVKLFK
ncbi:MAG: glycosyltransferase [Candidatus Parvarchaeota archaeon]|nr:glycosyltransferase [Candidatus Jingweiarchaeum tengchongense]MCW1310751.1 glycosyltransferase [Candidatus Jingweiarchaeum tengchongense]